jgi:S1-C subfamily serine protease
MGIVSTTGGPWRSWRGGVIDQFIRLDAALYPSSSGAAVTDASGRVMGIATAGLSRTSAIAIPRTTVDQVVSQLVERGRVARGYLGIGLQPVPLPDHLKGKVGGGQTSAVIVLSVEPQGPAAAAGLTIGDVLLRFNGKPLADTDDLQTALGAAGVGGKANLDLLRGGEFTTVEVTVGERPRKE